MSIQDKIRINIALKLSLIFFSVFIMAIGIIYLYVVPQLESQLTSQKITELRNYATLYSDSFLAAYNQGASPVYQDLLTQQYAERADARILLMDVSGNLISDSLKGQAFDRADYPVAELAIVNRQTHDGMNIIDDRNYAMAAVPLFSGNAVVRVIVVSSSLDDVEAAVALVQRQLSIAAAGALLIALCVIYIASHFLARRIRRIETGANKIAQGDFAAKVPVSSQDELGQLARTFNEMGEKLGSAFKLVDVEKRRAMLLLDDLDEGVIGVDSDGNVIFANPAAGGLLGKDIVPPAPLAEQLPEEVLSLWESMNGDSPSREDTFMLEGERALQVHTSIMSDQQELSSLLVLRDVSQEVKLDRSRRDFIANASHELKTPLFSLSGFLEILQDEDVDEATKDEFIATMREQVDRLVSLSKSLLDLSQMETGAISVHSGPVNMREVADAVAREFGIRPVADGSRIDTTGLPEDLTARCDHDRAAQLVRILYDNALKYSPDGSAVEVAGSANGDTVSVTVSDHGPGIPEDELPRVFERFFRGKGAGRVRGTGLGMPIAQELARLMGGEVMVKSSGDGTAITVTLPANGDDENTRVD